MNLFRTGQFTLSSGEESDFKIDCDALTPEDWEAAALLISQRVRFERVVSVPTGGEPLAEALQQYAAGARENPVLMESYYSPPRVDATVLIVDDVLTTGSSMENKKLELLRSGVEEQDILGYVLFARKKPPRWIRALFVLQ